MMSLVEVCVTLYKTKKKSENIKKKTDSTMKKKIEKASDGGKLCPIFYKFQDLLFFYENKAAKSLRVEGT